MNFRERVIAIINKIPYGTVTTYGTVAIMAGKPRAAIIVGGILAAAAEDLPWQRVVNREGYLSIKNHAYPKALQKALLEQEGVEVSDKFIVDLRKYAVDSSELEIE